MEYLQLKKATFYSDKVVLHKKKGDVTIGIDDIYSVNYDKPSFFNFFLMVIGGSAFLVGAVALNLKKKVNGRRFYIVRIKYKDVCRLPEFYLKKIDPTNRWGLWKRDF